jgi:lysophospholipase
MPLKVKKLPPPKNWTIGHFTTSDGKDLRYAVIDSCKEQTKGKVVLTGGYGLDIEYYRKAIKNWSKRGYDVYAMDLYGQGGSERQDPEKPGRPSTLGFEGHADILHEFINGVVKPDPAQNNILSAHSQSGGIVPVYLEKHEKDENFPFNMAVLGSPLFALNTFGETPGKLFRAFIYAADYFGFSNMPLKIQPPARLKAAFQRAAKDTVSNDNKGLPRISFRDDEYPAEMGYPTIAWFKSFFESKEKMTSAFFKSIQTPVLIISPAEDEYVSVTAKEHAAGFMANAEMVSIPDAKHGIWYDRNSAIQRKLWRTIDRFIGKHSLLSAPALNAQNAAATKEQPQHDDIGKKALAL